MIGDRIPAVPRFEKLGKSKLFDLDQVLIKHKFLGLFLNSIKMRKFIL